MHNTSPEFIRPIGRQGHRRITWFLSDELVLKLAVAYLALPYFLFFFGWLRRPVALVLIVILAAAFIWVWWMINNQEVSQGVGLNSKRVWLILAFLVLGAWLVFSGAGHFADQVGDYKKHNLILSHLIYQDWPVIQHITDRNAYVLVYYIAYYLPAGLVGKVFGLLAANIFQYAFTLIGLFIAFYLFLSFTKARNPLLLAIIFIVFGGLDVLGWLFVKGRLPVLGGYIEPWSQSLSYQGMSDIIYFVPQQALPGWIATGIFLWCTLEKKGFGYLVLVWSLTILWAPWISLGLLPILLWVFIQNLSKWKEFLTFVNIVPSLGIGIVMYLFFSTNQYSVGYNGWIWNFTENWLWTYLVFFLCEVLILAGVVGWSFRKDNTIRPLVWVAVIPLLIIPLYHSGVFNDYCMRASIPSLTILMLLTIRAILDSSLLEMDRAKWVARIAIILILAVGSLYNISRIGSSIENTVTKYGGFFYAYSEPYEPNLFDSFNNIPSDIILEQYLARNVDYRQYQWLFKY